MAGYSQVPLLGSRGGDERASSDDGEEANPGPTVRGRESLVRGVPSEVAAKQVRRQPPQRSWCLFSLVTLFCFFTTLMLIKFSLFDAFVSSAPPQPAQPEEVQHDEAGDFRRSDSDYVLGSDWDFHAPPTVRTYNWVIQDIIANPDGVFRPMIAINGKFPGELIRCNEGDTIVVNVDNQAANATAIHWHGIFQNGTNFMDGVPGVTQCPIAPGKKFRYEFVVTGQAGTCKPCLPTQAISELG